MKQLVHRTAAIIATLCIGVFYISSALVELFGSLEMIATVKSIIVNPGLFILVPAVAITAGTGFSLAGKRKGGLIDKKKKRMPLIGVNGILVLLPAAIYLDHLAASGQFGMSFYLAQGFELLVGGVNFILMSCNIRDGFKLSGRFRQVQKVS